jgi:hypothetical protein
VIFKKQIAIEYSIKKNSVTFWQIFAKKKKTTTTTFNELQQSQKSIKP